MKGMYQYAIMGTSIAVITNVLIHAGKPSSKGKIMRDKIVTIGKMNNQMSNATFHFFG